MNENNNGSSYNLEYLVNEVIKETFLSKHQVESVVVSLLKTIQEATAKSNVSIRGFGTFKPKVIKRRYFDIPSASMKKSIKPKVAFTPADGFLELIKTSKKDEISKLEAENDT